MDRCWRDVSCKGVLVCFVTNLWGFSGAIPCLSSEAESRRLSDQRTRGWCQGRRWGPCRRLRSSRLSVLLVHMNTTTFTVRVITQCLYTYTIRQVVVISPIRCHISIAIRGLRWEGFMQLFNDIIVVREALPQLRASPPMNSSFLLFHTNCLSSSHLTAFCRRCRLAEMSSCSSSQFIVCIACHVTEHSSSYSLSFFFSMY